MAGLLNQIGAVTALNVRSIPQRGAMSIASVVAVALTITVLLFFLALSNGLKRTVEGSGADDVAVVLREGSNAELNSVVSRDQLNILSTGPGVISRNGAPVVSGELLVIVDGIRRDSGTKANMPFRGIGPEGLALRRGVNITQGRMFTPGTNEIVVGAGLLREFAGFEFGETIRLRGGDWQIVGVFEAPGTVFESELWADVTVTQSLFNRPNVYQTMRVQLANAQAVDAFNTWAENDPRLNGLEALSERAYYARQASQSTAQFTIIAWALGVMMAIGALAGALNTMYSSVASRSTEIATLRIIGFSGYAAFFGTMVEALALSALGGVLGILLAFVAFNGRTTSTLGSGFTQLVFKFELSPGIIISAVVVALIIGLVGGILPGIRAARQRPQLELAAA
ncbi:ABC-type antimicrobial peptide transport system permease component [alpha proteobacterium U9-1i]|nr:ABC-type antimicrobial peptide transport system permease component [alpha proteobacterium U9-1i]